MARWLLRVGKAVLAVVAILIWFQAVTTLPGWLVSVGRDAAGLGGTTLVRMLLALLGFILLLVVIGPERARAWFQSPVKARRASWAPRLVKAPPGSVPTVAGPVELPTRRGAPLQPRYEQRPPYRQPSPNTFVVEHRIGVYNPQGQSAATHVRVELVGLSPSPRHVAQYPPVIPFAVPMVNGGDEHIGVTLPSGRQELWRIGYAGTGTDGTISVGQIAVADLRWRGLTWRFDPDERWRLIYQIVSDNRPHVEFSVIMTADNGVLHCSLEG
jgi:hypothetical protein